jgi:hypothetical protein
MQMYQTHDDDRPQMSDELRLIPRWSIALGVAAFAAVQYIMHVYLPQYHHEEGPNAFRIFVSLMWGTLLAMFTIMVGYITRDAKRRGMNVAMWTVLAVGMQGIGLVVYFLLRQPVMSHCPQCSTTLLPAFNFCPQCQFQLNPMCAECNHSVRLTDTYCGYCGHILVSPSDVHQSDPKLRRHQS